MIELFMKWWDKTLFVLFPLTAVLYLTKQESLSFISASITICLLSGLLGKAMGQYEYYAGPFKSALLNSFVGNIAELIIAIFALYLGNIELVKGSIIGSIIGNLLVVIGACFIAGAWKKHFHFNKIFVRTNVAVLLVLVVVILLPSILTREDLISDQIKNYSLWMSLVLLSVYLVLIIRNNKDHSVHALFSREKPIWSKGKARFMVLLSAGLTLPVAFILVEGVKGISDTLGINQLAMGMFFIPPISNIPENSSAVRFAYKSDPDMAMAIPLASSIQMALFVLPIIVIFGFFTDHPISLMFNNTQLVSIGVAFFVAQQYTHDGIGTRFFGFLMLVVYLCLGIAALHFGGIK